MLFTRVSGLGAASPASGLLRVLAPAGDAVAVFEILRGKNVGVAGCIQQLARGPALVPAVFEQQPTAWLQVLAGGADDAADVGQAVGTGGECAGRFEAQVALGEMRVGGFDVG